MKESEVLSRLVGFHLRMEDPTCLPDGSSFSFSPSRPWNVLLPGMSPYYGRIFAAGEFLTRDWHNGVI
jgi:hypothetical protein